MSYMERHVMTTARANWIVGTLLALALGVCAGLVLLAIGEGIEQAYDTGYSDGAAGRAHQ